MHKGILLLFIAVGLAACNTSQLRIHTSPSEAEVYARPIGGGELQLLGKTPLFMDSTEVEKRFGIANAFYVEIRKEGYKPDSLFITEISRVDVSINRELQAKRDLEMQTWLNSHITDMFEVRRLVQAKNYDSALKLVQKLKDVTPMVSMLHEMEAGILLLKQSYRMSLDAYRMALRFNPENTEVVKMIRYLEKTYGFPKEVDVTEVLMPETRKPASESKSEPEAESEAEEGAE